MKLSLYIRSRHPWLLALGAFTLGGLALLGAGFYFAGYLLLVDSEPHPADVGVVLAGHFARASYAADLYRQGMIGRVWVTKPVRESVLAQLDALSILYPRQEEISRAVLLKKGVPEDRIEIIGDGVVSTMAEAKLVAELLGARPEIRSLLIITTRVHVRRARAIFDRVGASVIPVHILIVGSPHDEFMADQWWRDRDSAREVILESAKLLLLWTKEEL